MSHEAPQVPYSCNPRERASAILMADRGVIGSPRAARVMVGGERCAIRPSAANERPCSAQALSRAFASSLTRRPPGDRSVSEIRRRSNCALTARSVRLASVAPWSATIVRMFDRTRAVAQVEAGNCACAGCRGELTDAALSQGRWRFCRVCRCAWKVSAIDGQTYATAIPSPGHGIPTRKADPHHPLDG